MERAVKAGDADAYHLLNLEFHDTLVEFTGNRKLTAMYRLLINELSLFRRLNLADAQRAADLGVGTQRHRQGDRERRPGTRRRARCAST